MPSKKPYAAVFVHGLAKKPAPSKGSAKPDAKQESKTEAKSEPKSEKLRMRLNPKTGKLERVDEPKLF